MRERTFVALFWVAVLLLGAVAPAGVAAADTQESEPNDDFGSAQPIPEGVVDGRVVDGEVDIYRIDLNGTDALDVRLSPASADLEVRIYGPDRTELAADGFVDQGATDRLTVEASESGTYYVEVTGTDRQTTTAYRLQSNRTDPVPGCGPPGIADNPRPTDPDGDGLCEDVSGDGTVNVIDVAVLLENLSSPAVTNNPAAFDFKADGRVNVIDVAELLASL
jgi:hypothetical protein